MYIYIYTHFYNLYYTQHGEPLSYLLNVCYLQVVCRLEERRIRNREKGVCADKVLNQNIEYSVEVVPSFLPGLSGDEYFNTCFLEYNPISILSRVAFYLRLRRYR